MKTSILVTGGCGFVGRNLCKRLLKLDDNNQVYCLDNLQSTRVSNIEELLDNPRFCFIKHDVLDDLPTSLPRFDEIYHLACPASPPQYQKNPINTLEVCFKGTQNILNKAKECNAKFLFTSTSEIYGDPLEHPQKETYTGNVGTITLRACYDEGKRVAETLVTEYKRCFDVDVRIARIFNTYGPYLDKDDGRVISNFICQALQNQDLTVYGDGEQTRSFCYVDDTVDGIIKLMASTNSGGMPVNIGNPNEMSIKQVVEIILDLIPTSTSKVIYKPLPDADPKKRNPCIQRAWDLLRWKPTIDFREGLKQTIGYFQTILA